MKRPIPKRQTTYCKIDRNQLIEGKVYYEDFTILHFNQE